jgi:hypothetical protein
MAATLVSLQRLNSHIRQNYYRLQEIRTTGWGWLPSSIKHITLFSRSFHHFSAKYIRQLDGGRTDGRTRLLLFAIFSSALCKKHPVTARYLTGFILSIYIERRMWDRVDGLPISYGLGGSGFEFQQKAVYLLLSKTSQTDCDAQCN